MPKVFGGTKQPS